MSTCRLGNFKVRTVNFFLASSVAPFLCGIFSSHAWGGEIQLIPSVQIQEKYDDNIFYSGGDSQESDLISIVTPGFEFKVEDPRGTASLKGSVAGISYLDNEDLNAVDQFVTAGLSYMFTQRLRSKVNLNLTRDSQRDRDVLETGLPVPTTSDRERQQYNVGGDFTFSEKTAVNFSYAFNRDRYESASLTGFKANSFGLGMNHDLSRYLPELLGMIEINHKLYDYPEREVQNTTVTFGASWKYSEKVSLSGMIGPRFTVSEYYLPVTIFGFPTGRLRTETDDGQGVGGRLSYVYQGLLTRWELSLANDLESSSGRSAPTERSTTALDVSRRLTENLALGLRCSYYENKTEQGLSGTQEFNSRTMQAKPRITYQVSQHLGLLASFDFWQIHENPGDSDRTRNLVLLQLLYQYPLFD